MQRSSVVSCLISRDLDGSSPTILCFASRLTGDFSFCLGLRPLALGKPSPSTLHDLARQVPLVSVNGRVRTHVAAAERDIVIQTL